MKLNGRCHECRLSTDHTNFYDYLLVGAATQLRLWQQIDH